MTVQPMSLQRFRSLVTAYGSRVSNWPEREREAALALLEVSEPARLWTEEESSFDRVFASFAPPALSPALQRRLSEIPLRAGTPRRARWPFKSLWAPALGWAAAAVLGVALGSAADDPSQEATWDATAELTASDATHAATDEPLAEDALLSLALGSVDDLEGMP